MKKIQLLICFLIPLLINAAIIKPTKSLTLIAYKDKQEYIYQIGSPLKVIKQDSLGNEIVVKGYLDSIVENGIYLKSYKKKNSSIQFIPLKNIQAINQLHLKGKKIFLKIFLYSIVWVLLSILIFVTGAVGFFILTIIPGEVFFWTGAIGFLVILFQSSSRGKSLNGGWSFKIS